MVTTNQTLEQQLKAFRQSSSFTPGDTFSFSIKFNDTLSLPGKHDPAAYLDKSGVDLSGDVCVVCPANGGLCVELLKRGTRSVMVFEPRPIYQKAINEVTKFAAAALGKPVLGVRYQVTQNSPFESNCYDTIIWSEGLEDIRDPANLLKAILNGLRPGGTLVIEVALGGHAVLPATINSWKPTAENFEASIKKFEGFEITAKRPGRNQMRTIYTIKNTKVPPTATVLSSAAPTEAVDAPKPAKEQVIEQSEEEKKALYESPLPETPAPKRRPRKPKPPTAPN